VTTVEQVISMDDQWLQEQSDKAIIREHLTFFELIQREENVGMTITRHQSRRILRMGLTIRGKGNHYPLRLTGYSARLLEEIQQESPSAEASIRNQEVRKSA